MINKERCNDIIYLIRYSFKLIDADLDQRLNEYGLTGVQGRILFFISHKTLKEHKNVHQNDIENEYHLSKSTVSGIVKRMNKNGFLNIEKQHPYAIITPTDKAKDVLTHLGRHREEAVNKLLKDIPEDKRQELALLLNKLITNMEGGNENVGKD